MKFKLISISLIVMSVLTAFSFKDKEIPVEIIPQPNHLQVHKGDFKVAGAVFSYTPNELEARTILAINSFASQISLVTGQQNRVETDGSAKDKGFVFQVNSSLGKEEYTINIDSDKALIQASAFQGFFYAIQSLAQMLPVEYFAAEKNTKVDWLLPQVEIKDAPRFAYRGMMLDVSRHFYTVDQVKKVLDIMAMHKLNRFHWHLTEDQGWRIEIKRYPKLTEIGAYRDSSILGPWRGDKSRYDGKRYGGFYTQEQIKEVVAYAYDRGITIIPEIDLPGHMVAALASYPELGCTKGPYNVRVGWGIANEVLCPGKETTFDFIEGVLTEVMDLFPSKYIHVGGDECPKVEWAKCPDCQKRIKDLGIKSDEHHSKEAYLQNYVTARVQKFLNEHGRSLIGWDEILEGNLAEGATVMSWRGVKGGVEAAKRGFDVIMSPNTYMYFDYYQGKDYKKEPLAIGGFLPVERVYSYEPYDGIPDEAHKHILGVQANIWTEYIAKEKHLDYMYLPRIDALSSVQWCDRGTKDFARFKQSVHRMFQRYDALGYSYSKVIDGIYGLEGVSGGTN